MRYVAPYQDASTQDWPLFPVITKSLHQFKNSLMISADSSALVTRKR